MKRIETKLDIDESIHKNILACLPCPADKACSFDIETTGLSPQISSLYLIGAAYVKDGSFYLVQWFADDYISEKEILSSFAEFSSAFCTFVHYNGATFDIPYLEKKYSFHKLPSPFDGRESLDLYRLVKKKKNLFKTPDMKLQTMEKLLCFQRNDRFTGKDCIELYTEFMQRKFFRDEKAKLLQNNLLLHNHDDLVGTLLCTQLLAYSAYTPNSPVWRKENGILHIQDSTALSYPVCGRYEKDGVFFSFHEHQIALQIPLYQGTLYHFFKDYKNYFYLPEEDMAVHKSVSSYVDKEFREPASAANCYTRKSGSFLPQQRNIMKPEFLKQYKDKTSYFEVTDDFCSSDIMLRRYVDHILKYMFETKK